MGTVGHHIGLLVAHYTLEYPKFFHQNWIETLMQFYFSKENTQTTNIQLQTTET
jgi:hypothetical protein